MSKQYKLTPADRAAVFQTANNLGMDPYSFGAILQQESGINPNIWGGQGGNYYGAIQFGKTERGEAGLDPSRIGNYTLAEQMPHVEKWLKGRGYKPGMGVEKVYATILGGNPDANIYAKDSFGTSVADSVKRFKPGGVHYATAQNKLGVTPEGALVGQPQQPGTTTDATKSNLRNSITNNFLTNYIFGTADTAKKEDKPKSLVDQLKQNLLGQVMGMASQRGSTASLAQQVINQGRSEEEQRKKRSLPQQLVDQIKLGGGFVSPGSLMQNYNDFYNRLF